MSKYHNINYLKRYENNPILSGKDFPDEYDITYCFNSGITKFKDKYLMMCRLEDLTSTQHFWIADSEDGINFTPRDKPVDVPVDMPIEPHQTLIYYDPRISQIGDTFYIMFACHTLDTEPRIALMTTVDFEDFKWIGLVSEPNNRNGIMFPEKINGKFVRLDRPGTSWDGGDMWMSESVDLVHWGNARRIMKNTDTKWAWTKVGGGAPPIKTSEGWLNIFHGVITQCKAHLIYKLGVCLHDLDDPAKIISISDKPIFIPETDYELLIRTPSVVFSGGAILEDDNTVKVYYGGSDAVQCLAITELDTLISLAKNEIK